MLDANGKSTVVSLAAQIEAGWQSFFASINRQLEILTNPDLGRREWQITKEQTLSKGKPIDIWHIAPKPYKYGFGSALSEVAAKLQFEVSSTSVCNFARGIIWC